MDSFEILDSMLDAGNGYLFTADVVARGISKPTLAKYVKNNSLERVAHGIYLSDDAWPDGLFLINMQNRRICYSMETALYLHGLMEREPSQITVTVKAGYNATHLRKKGIRVLQVNQELYELGVTGVLTSYGNRVTVYDKERTICDIVKNKERLDVQVFQTAMKEYMTGMDKNLIHLMRYAAKMKIESEIRKYTEVML